METLIFFLKVVIMGVIGNFIVHIFNLSKNRDSLLISPFYTLFSILAGASTETDVIFLFVSGVVWGSFVNIYLKSCTQSLYLKINPLLFGIFNILNVFLLNRLLEAIFENTKWTTVGYLSLSLLFIGFIDLSIALRKNI